jgi:hypothetical protein
MDKSWVLVFAAVLVLGVGMVNSHSIGAHGSLKGMQKAMHGELGMMGPNKANSFGGEGAMANMHRSGVKDGISHSQMHEQMHDEKLSDKELEAHCKNMSGNE